MKLKMKVKILTDLLMTVLLMLLMSYQIIGQELHEWFGAGMLVLFVIHNLLNIRWYGSLFSGKYKPLRIFATIINFAVLIDIVLLGCSGIVMSRHLFAFLPIKSGMAASRMIHLAGSYWGLALMSMHLGIHWGRITGVFKRLVKGERPLVLIWIARLLAVTVAGCGAYFFLSADIMSYMLLKTEFVFFDFEQSAVSVLANTASMMVMWAVIGYYAAKGLGKLSALQANRKEKGHEKN